MANTVGLGATSNGGVGQEFCLKWNNHRTTILSVMDTLLEEESLVDVTLSADGQFIRAHRVILSACSPYFRQLFKSSFLNDKHPVIIMKDVDFDNLKCLVEYMYKGEANVPQHMLPSFIQTAESLQIRGLAEGASKQKLEQVAELNNISPHLNIPTVPITPQIPHQHQHQPQHFNMKQENSKKTQEPSPGGILAARLAKMVENPPMQMFDFHEQLALAARNHTGIVPPPMKKPRKTPVTSSPVKTDSNGLKQEISVKKDLMAKNVRLSPKTSNIMAPTTVSTMVSSLSLTNNNDESDSDVLKIDEDGDFSKENKENNDEKDASDDDIAEVDNENGLDDSEEEIAMGNKEIVERTGNAVGFINPWTGEEMPGMAISDHEEDSLHGDGPIFPSLMDQSGLSRADLVDEKPNMHDSRDPMTNKYSCTRCGRSYLHQATLVRHQRYECGISASYPCQLCGRKFKRRDVLKGHMEKCMNKSNVSSPSAPTSVPTVPSLSMSIPSVPSMSSISAISMSSMPSIASISSLASTMAGMPPLPYGP